MQGKVWGRTGLVYADDSTEIHWLEIQAGGFSSVHCHHAKWGRFLVLSGQLLVRIFRAVDQPVDETVIGPLGMTDVEPGVRHQFQALTDVLAVEIGWVRLDPNDIDRGDSVGGCRLPPTLPPSSSSSSSSVAPGGGE